MNYVHTKDGRFLYVLHICAAITHLTPCDEEYEAELRKLKREARLLSQHEVKVKKSWKRAKRVVKRGDDKGERALKAFLKAYA